jgi:Flp pilus assembly protein TadG
VRGWWHGRRRRRSQDDRGSASIELVILLPAMFAVMFLGMQAALYYHARNVATAAASEGARVAAVENARTFDGISAASRFVADAGGDRVLAGLAVSGDRSPSRVVITERLTVEP